MNDNAKFKNLSPNEQWAIRQMALNFAIQAREDNETLTSTIRNASGPIIDYLLNGGRELEIFGTALPDANFPDSTLIQV